MDEVMADVNLPDGVIPLREIRLVHYLDPDGRVGLALGYTAEPGEEGAKFDMFAMLGMLRMAEHVLLTQESGEGEEY